MPDYYHLLKDKRVALVGKAGYLDNFEFGDLIDNYDLIIRVNHYTLIKPEMSSKIGHRTDIIYSSLQLEDLELLSSELTQDLQLFVGNSANSSRRKHFERTPFNCKTALINPQTLEQSKILFPQGDGALMGTLAIMDLLNSEAQEIFLSGFDFYQTDSPMHNQQYEPELWKKYGGGGPFTHHPQEQFQWFLTLRDERIKTDPHMTQLRRKWELDTLGYTVIKNLYTDSEMDKIRKTSLEYLNQGHGEYSLIGHTSLENRVQAIPDAINQPELFPAWNTILSPKFFLHLRRILQSEELCYCHNSDLQMNRWTVGWHRDHLNPPYQNYARTNFWDADQPYTNYRFALYLQDCSIENKMGLTVKPTSHLSPTEQGTEKYLATESGDLIIFDARLLHQGMTNPPLEFTLDRMSYFFNFGIPSLICTEHSQGSIARQCQQRAESIDAYAMIPEIIKLFRNHNIEYQIEVNK